MPEPQPHQATCTGGVSVFPPLAHIGLARLTCRCLLKACRSVAQALEHEGIRDATGTEVVGHYQERAMPQPQPRQSTYTVGVSVLPPLAHCGLARLESAVRGDGS